VRKFTAPFFHNPAPLPATLVLYLTFKHGVEFSAQDVDYTIRLIIVPAGFSSLGQKAAILIRFFSLPKAESLALGPTYTCCSAIPGGRFPSHGGNERAENRDYNQATFAIWLASGTKTSALP
jgi:hypothetical protein